MNEPSHPSLETTLKAVEGYIATAEAAKADADAKVAALKLEITSLEAQVGSLKRQKTAIESKIAQLLDDEAIMQARLVSEATVAKERLKKANAEWQMDQQKAIAELEDQRKTVLEREQRSTLVSERLLARESALQEAENDLNIRLKKVQSDEAKIVEDNLALDQRQEQLDAYKARCEQLGNMAAAKHKKADTAMQDAKKATADMESQRSNLQSLALSLKAQSDRVASQEARMTAKLREVQVRSDALQTKEKELKDFEIRLNDRKRTLSTYV